jgi:hypothetical protein
MWNRQVSIFETEEREMRALTEMQELIDPELDAVGGGQFQLPSISPFKGFLPLFQLGRANFSIANSFNTTTQSGQNIAVVSGNTGSTINITETIYNIYNYYSC